MQFNLLMVVAVDNLVGPRGRSLLRSAGRIGVVAFMKVFATVPQGIWVELPSCPALQNHITSPAGGDGVVGPMQAPLSGTTFSKVNRRDATVFFDVNVDSSLMTAKRFLNPIKQVCNRKDIQHAVICLPSKDPQNTLTILRRYFMMDTRCLRTLTIHGLENITNICSHFLFNCKKLEHIDLTALTNMRTIGSHFMSGCSSVKSVQFGRCEQLEEIFENFMSGCSSLTSLELNGFPNVHRIHIYFLADCTSLVSITFTDWCLHHIPCYFMSGCTSLKMLDLRTLCPSLPNPGINTFFLNRCTSLTRLILPKLESTGHHFLSGCTSLKGENIDFGGTPNRVAMHHLRFIRAHNLPLTTDATIPVLPPVAWVGALLPPTQQAFLRSAGSEGSAAFDAVVRAHMLGVYVELKSSPSMLLDSHCAPIDTTLCPPPTLPPNTAVVLSNYASPVMFSQPSAFFNRVKLTGVENVTDLAYGYAAEMQFTEELEIVGPMDSLASLSPCAFYKSHALQSIRLPPLPNVTNIGFGFMSKCTSLTTFTLSGLVNLTYIDSGFLEGCTSLVALDLGSLPALCSIGVSFLGECLRVKSVTMTDMASLEYVILPFLGNLPALDHRNITGNLV